MKKTLIEVGYTEQGELDFGVSMVAADLTMEQMDKLRTMITVAIGSMEEIFRREQMQKSAMAQKEIKD